MFQLLRFMRFVILVFGILSITQCSDAEMPIRQELRQKWESIFFSTINAATETSGNVALRKKPLRAGDLEIRIWRSSLSPFEGVIIERSQDVWSATHLISDDLVSPTQTVVKPLPEPQRGWPELWERLSAFGILELPGAHGEDCIVPRLDGTNYVVEISERGRYRTYMYLAFVPTCYGSNRMDIISEIIGTEFHDGISKCKQAEWFSCADLLRNQRLDIEATGNDN